MTGKKEENKVLKLIDNCCQFKKLGDEVDEDDLEDVMDEYDEDESGEIEFSE